MSISKSLNVELWKYRYFSFWTLFRLKQHPQTVCATLLTQNTFPVVTVGHMRSCFNCSSRSETQCLSLCCSFQVFRFPPRPGPSNVVEGRLRNFYETVSKSEQSVWRCVGFSRVEQLWLTETVWETECWNARRTRFLTSTLPARKQKTSRWCQVKCAKRVLDFQTLST